MRHVGGIDLGGSKIEARLFDADLVELDRRRIATPVEDYNAMVNGLLDMIQWLDEEAPGLPIGVGVPGLINPQSGQMLTANLPASGHTLEKDVSTKFGRPIYLINDCRAFTFSEANLGAARNYHNVVGLVIGTGVAGGQVLANTPIMTGFNGQYGEYGHLPLPADFAYRHSLPAVPCGCGLIGCFETYLAGPGLVRLARHLTGIDADTRQITVDSSFTTVMDIWAELGAELIALLTRTVDPDVIVLGGGLGTLPGVPELILNTLPSKLLAGTIPPQIVQAEGGDASGARGAALHALQQGADRDG